MFAHAISPWTQGQEDVFHEAADPRDGDGCGSGHNSYWRCPLWETSERGAFNSRARSAVSVYPDAQGSLESEEALWRETRSGPRSQRGTAN